MKYNKISFKILVLSLQATLKKIGNIKKIKILRRQNNSFIQLVRWHQKLLFLLFMLVTSVHSEGGWTSL